jgi:phosphohistidine swiveling domain-containing protein
MVTLFGRSANIGYAIGKAVVLKKLPKPEENIVFSPGDILIVPNLAPDMIIKIIGIGGIVAEVGGVTSHAATLARELGIPCVVAVSNIIELVHDGALVEIESEKGIVRYSNP